MTEGRKLRLRTLRRIRAGLICGRRLRSGYLCTRKPAGHGLYCAKCGNGKAHKPSNNQGRDAASVDVARVLELYAVAGIPPEHLDRLERLMSPGADLTNELITLRLRLDTLNRQYAIAAITVAEYERRSVRIIDSIAKLARVQQLSEGTGEGIKDVADAWDPYIEAAAESDSE